MKSEEVRNICKTILKKTWKDKVGEKRGMTGAEACVYDTLGNSFALKESNTESGFSNWLGRQIDDCPGGGRERLVMNHLSWGGGCDSLEKRDFKWKSQDHQHVISTYYKPGIMLDTMYILSSFIFILILWGRYIEAPFYRQENYGSDEITLSKSHSKWELRNPTKKKKKSNQSIHSQKV